MDLCLPLPSEAKEVFPLSTQTAATQENLIDSSSPLFLHL